MKKGNRHGSWPTGIAEANKTEIRMRNIKWIIIPALLAIMAFLPVFTVNVVPEWSLRLIGEDGQPVPNARVDQSWKDYSLEFWTVEQHVDHSVSSDADGIVRFPARDIHVSAFQIVAAKVRDVVVSINPHSGYGPHSYALCRGSLDCSTSYEPGEELPKVVVVKR